MWFSLAVLLLASCCLVDVTHAEETKENTMSASRLASVRSRRMVGGMLAPHVPWQAMIYLSDNVVTGGYAGGALISDRWILTAGRNLFVRKTRQDTQGQNPVIPKVYLGIRGLPEATEAKQVAVEKIVLHPGFQNHTDWDNDLALIKLKEPVVINDKVTPIPLPEANQHTLIGPGVITGWGWGHLLTASESLKHMTLPLAPVSSCRYEFTESNTTVVDGNVFCTRPAPFDQNVCFGDAGGALAVIDDNTGDVYAQGILSYDKPCRRQRYAVYMKVSAYLPWIHSVIRGDTEGSAALRVSVMKRMYSL
ncbi:haptoglobin [Cheilinus undulatus]|uniref:haptoglobin n=1 Tax=Cheilinus undulatus TaxID=241271 RepID=UPI001BD67527|nr:haptoglobin [Cheilinus undulatus]